MKQNTFKWLSCSLILLIILSCKKEKGALDDFDPGRFDYSCIWIKNGVEDTVSGEASGPYIQGGDYIFRVRNKLEPTNTTFKVGRIKSPLFSAPYLPLAFTVPVTSLEHDSDHLWVDFQKVDNTVSGSFTLTRKQ